MKALCPCGSGESYGRCCMPLHEGGVPQNALALMRSRYTAYYLNDVDYIIQTTHLEHPGAMQSIEIQRKEISLFCESTEFRGLEILEVQEAEPISSVTFRVQLFQKGQDCSFIEKSYFKKNSQGAWQYLDGVIS